MPYMTQLYHIQFSLKHDKHYYIKDGLAAYRNITQSTNVSSLETVLKYYLDTVEKSFSVAIKSITQQSDYLKEIEDEENPVDLFLNTLENKIDTVKEDISRRWKLLMEAYRTELELIYKNKKLEEMYCHVAKKALKMCKKYSKKSDFKKLCEVIRMHQYQNVKTSEKPASAPGMAFALNIKDEDTNDRLMDLRMFQIEITKEMDLWQDAYRIMEDINVLLKNRKKTANDLLTKYYQHLYEIFWHSKHYLLHAVSLHSYFACLRKRADEKEQCKFVSHLILAALSIPKGNLEESTNIEIFRRNALLINSAGQIMNREQLLNNLKNGTYLDICSPEVKSIFSLMNDCKDILKFSKSVEKTFAKLNETEGYKAYLPLIEQNIIASLVDKLSTLYKSLSFTTFKKILGFLDFSKCEKYLLYNQNTSFGVKAQIDYEKGMLIFDHNGTYGERLTTKLVSLINNIGIANKHLLRVKMSERQEVALLEKQCIVNAKRLIEEAEDDLRRKKDEASKQTMPANLINQQRDEILRKRNIEEEQKKTIQKQERMYQEADQKTLAIYMERVRNIIKLDKNASYKGKKLDAWTEIDLIGIDIDILIDIEHSIKAKKQRQEEDKLEKQFKNRDYLERMIRKKRTVKLLEERNKVTVDLEEQQRVAKEVHEAKLKAKEELKGVSGFVKSFKAKLDATRQDKYEKLVMDYKKALSTSFAQTIYTNAVKKKAEEDEQRTKEEAIEKARREAEEAKMLKKNDGKAPLPNVELGRSKRTAAELQTEFPNSSASGMMSGLGDKRDEKKPEAPTRLERGQARRGEIPAAQAGLNPVNPATTTKRSELAMALDDESRPAATGRLFRGTAPANTLAGATLGTTQPATGSLLQRTAPTDNNEESLGPVKLAGRSFGGGAGGATTATTVTPAGKGTLLNPGLLAPQQAQAKPAEQQPPKPADPPKGRGRGLFSS